MRSRSARLCLIAFAKNFDCTAADAKRAFVDLDIKEADEQTLLLAMANFAGRALLERQRLQAAQKGQVTRKKNEIKKIELEFAETIKSHEKEIQEMRSSFIPVISKIYKFANQFGLTDTWIEALLATYEEHQQKSA